MQERIGILYDKGEVFLAGKKKLSRSENYKVVTGLADILKEILFKINKSDPSSAENIKRILGKTYRLAYLSIMSGNNNSYKNSLLNFYKNIEEDKFVFEIKPEEDWKLYIINEPSSLNSFISLIMYCMILISSEFEGDINYILKEVDVIKHLEYKENLE